MNRITRYLFGKDEPNTKIVTKKPISHRKNVTSDILMSQNATNVNKMKHGYKKIEIQRSCPQVPFTVWVYENLGKRRRVPRDYKRVYYTKNGQDVIGRMYDKVTQWGFDYHGCGKVVAKYTVEAVEPMFLKRFGAWPDNHCEAATSALDPQELLDLAGISENEMPVWLKTKLRQGRVFDEWRNKTGSATSTTGSDVCGYVWHIKDYTVLPHETPLSSFLSRDYDVFDTDEFGREVTPYEQPIPIRKAPAGWQYCTPREDLK